MNRYPIWKYAIMLVVLILSTLYAAPNFFGEAPAVQVTGKRATAKIDSQLQSTIEAELSKAKISFEGISRDDTNIKVRFADTNTQLKARDVLNQALNPVTDSPEYILAFNLVSKSPNWLTSLNAKPMYLGLDLRGGVHFLLQVDMNAALTKKIEAYTGDIRLAMREKSLRHNGISRDNQTISIKITDPATLASTKALLTDQFPDLAVQDITNAAEPGLTASIKPVAAKRIQDEAIKQNIVTLHNRINELGVAEPVIQQQGPDRIVVQLPGVQDPGRAQEILGRTATLEMRLVDESTEGKLAEGGGAVPFGSEKFLDVEGRIVIVKKQVILTGDSLTDAQPSFDQQNGNQPQVSLTVDAKGGRIIRDVSRENIKKRMALILFEKNKGQVLTAPVIQSELGNRFVINGQMNSAEAANLALLLRAGALAAPMDIIEQSTIGPSLGKENIAKGFNSVAWGFAVIVAFMCIYYMMFGAFSSMALGLNLLMLVAILSLIQATLTLPGVAAMALALGMAIDSNVLINERIREELRSGAAPQTAIAAGFDRAWATILDSNITTLIAGAALLAFGSGPVRGFAIVHCLGILTSMFSAVFFSRGLANLWYGRQKKLKSISIGTVWRPETNAANAAAVSKSK